MEERRSNGFRVKPSFGQVLGYAALWQVRAGGLPEPLEALRKALDGGYVAQLPRPQGVASDLLDQQRVAGIHFQPQFWSRVDDLKLDRLMAISSSMTHRSGCH